MNPFCDSGLLVKLYVLEPRSADADNLVYGCAGPPPLTPLQELEIRNTFRLKQACGEMTESECNAALSDFDSDIAAGFFERVHLDAAAVYREAENLSSEHTAATLCRTLDILHVAAALVIGANDFYTFDVRQAELARRIGLNVFP